MNRKVSQKRTVRTTVFLRHVGAPMANRYYDIAHLWAQLGTSHRQEVKRRVTLMGRIGQALILRDRDLNTAQKILAKGVSLAKRHRLFRHEVANRIRLAIALQHSFKHRVALEHFDQAMRTISEKRIRGYKDYVLQHKGKCLAEIEQFNKAAACLQEALRIRKRRGNQSLTKSTIAALQELSKVRRVRRRSK